MTHGIHVQYNLFKGRKNPGKFFLVAIRILNNSVFRCHTSLGFVMLTIGIKFMVKFVVCGVEHGYEWPKFFEKYKEDMKKKSANFSKETEICIDDLKVCRNTTSKLD